MEENNQQRFLSINQSCKNLTKYGNRHISFNRISISDYEMKILTLGNSSRIHKNKSGRYESWKISITMRKMSGNKQCMKVGKLTSNILRWEERQQEVREIQRQPS